MVDSPVTLWECIERAPRPFSKLKTYLLHLHYPSGWAVYDRGRLIERWSCPLSQAAYAPKRKKGRPSREVAVEMEMVEAMRDGKSIQNGILLDMCIANAYILIVRRWGFQRDQAGEALGKAAAEVLKRHAPDGCPLGGDMVKKLADLSPLSGGYRRYPNENISRHRPEAIQGYTEADLKKVCRRVLECGGHTPPEWEDISIF